MAKKNAKKKKGAGLVSIIFFVLALVCFAYGAAVLSFFRSRNWFNYIWFIAGAVMLLFSFLFSGSTGLPKAIKWILGILIIACLAKLAVCFLNHFLWGAFLDLFFDTIIPNFKIFPHSKML